jgi:hypothetical protein
MCSTSGHVVSSASATPPRIPHNSSARPIAGDGAQRVGDRSTPVVEGLSMSMLAIGQGKHT